MEKNYTTIKNLGGKGILSDHKFLSEDGNHFRLFLCELNNCPSFPEEFYFVSKVSFKRGISYWETLTFGLTEKEARNFYDKKVREYSS